MTMQVSGTSGFTFPDNTTQATAASGFGFKNRIINGNFDIWQRATSSSGSGYFFGADRWLSYGYGGANTTFSRQAFTLGQTAVPGNPNYFARLVCTNTRPYIEQRIENIAAYSGQQITVSLWVKSPDITATLNYAFYSYFGSSGSTPVSTTETSTGVSLSSSWQKVVFTYTMPSLAGKTIAGGNDYLGINFAPTSGNIGTLDIAQVQIEMGPTATQFDFRPYGTELALCQRYFEVLYSDNSGSQLIGTQRTASNFWSQWSYKQEKRTTPTISSTAAATFPEGTPNFYSSSTYTQLQRGGSFYIGSSSTNVAILQASAEL